MPARPLARRRYLRAMSIEAPLPALEGGSKTRPALRPFVLVIALVLAAYIGWLFWPSNPEDNPFDLSRADGGSRFCATTYPKEEAPANLSLRQRLLWTWAQYQRRHGKRNPTAYSFPVRPVQGCSIHSLLNQCMEISGTQYLIAVEIAGAVEFGSTNTLNGAQWMAACEHAIEASNPVVCYDYAKRRNFQDTLLVIRERPGVVMIVPRTKLIDYQKAGLVRKVSQ
jgi:hypothetical protein